MITITGERLELKHKVVREDHTFPKQINPLKTTVNITPEDYALILKGDFPNYSVDSAISMKQRFNGKNNLDTIVNVLKSGLAVPRTRDFIPHLLNINSQEPVVYNANGTFLEGQKLNEYIQTLNHNCWVWLNDFFEPSENLKGFLGLDLVTITGLENGEPVYQREPLEPCLEENCYAGLDSVNNQGFLTKRASVQKYKPGETVYFTCPKANSAVRFGADIISACLSCCGDSRYWDPELGVFPLASTKGTSLKKI